MTFEGENSPAQEASGCLFNGFVSFFRFVFLITIAIAVVLYFTLDEYELRNVFHQPISVTWKQVTTNCDELKTEIRADRACQNDPSCTLTRDEFIATKERSELYYVSGACRPE